MDWIVTDNKLNTMTKYIAGVDPYPTEGQSKGAICIMKRVGTKYEVCKTLTWKDNWKRFQKLRYRWEILKFWWKYYRGNLTIIKETNKPSKPTSYFKEVAHERHKGELHNTINDTIKYLRIMEKEHKTGEREMGGLEILHAWVQDGTIKPYLYFKMMQAIENPEAPYNITIT